MGRLLYGVLGDARGHISRALAIADRLRAHEIVFVGGGRVGEEMARHGYATVPVPMLATELTGQRVDLRRTTLNAVRALAESSSVLARLGGVIAEFDPDLIVTDYEHFLPVAARHTGRACVSVDRQHAVTHCRYDKPPGHRLSRILMESSIRLLYDGAIRFLICSFVPMKPRDPRQAEVFPAVLRDAVHTLRPSGGDHALVYVRGARPDWLRGLLSGRRRRYVIYGLELNREERNLRFRAGSPSDFLEDLAGCAYVVSNAGHNLISEALHFGKPLLCIPTPLIYEQLLNAHLLSRAGYGAYCEADRGAGRALDAFEAALPRFASAAAGYAPWSGEILPARLDALISGRTPSAVASAYAE